jgi:PhzF family phenazine biosynthesis protein
MQAGRVPVRAQGDRWTLTAAPVTWRECDIERSELAELLGVGAGDVGSRPLWVKAGKEQLIVPLTNERAVRAVRPRPELGARVRSEDGQATAYVFAELSPGRLLARFFFPDGAAILEDPATGSATANLGGWMLATGRAAPLHYEISQGEYAGRPSALILDVDTERNIFVSGDVIELASGTLVL